ITGPSAPIDYNVYPSLSPVIGIAVLSSSNVIQYNNVRYTDTRTGYDGSSDLITVSGALNEAENNLVTRNNLTAVGSGYLYGLNLGVNANYNNLTYNTLNINSSFYTYGVNILQVPMRDNYIAYNTMYLKSDDTAYGVLANVWGAPEVTNFRIANNNITVESVNAYGLQLAGSSYNGITFKNINITSNTINVTGTYAMGIGLAMTDNVYLYRNTLNIKGQTNETNTYSWDTVQSTTAGVYSADGNNTRLTSELRYDVTNGPDVIFKNMNNSLINRGAFVSNNDNFILENVENSLVNSTNANTTTEAAVDLVNSNGNEIKSNVFRAGNVGGNDAVVCDDASVDNIIESNTPITTYVEVTPDVLCIGMSGTITAKAVDSNQNDVTGTFALSLNGQEVYTSSGTTLSYDYTPTQVGDLEVTVTFTPEESGYLSRVNETVISVVEYGAVITVDDVTADAGETVTLTASVKDVFGVAVTKGKVTFKVNGKTVKDAYGKVIYAKVTDGVATVEYTVPEDYTGKNFTITAVYSGSSGLAKVQNTSTLTVNSPEASIEFENDPVTASVGQTVTFTVKVTDDVSKVVFKINGKTVKDANGKVIYAKVVDGIASIDYVIPEDMKAKDYTLTAVTMGSERLTAEQTLTIIKQ
ncbi:MAG: Ig-like domain-containing protein, partial [Methanosphaera sp.]|nr:Ig-like domain-containing protein [Methanosphaera sp.]